MGLTDPIVVKVDLNPLNPTAIVRKVVFNKDGTVNKKYGLNKDGRWIEVPEATNYPDECYLPVASVINYSTKMMED